jgi:hypothetical protein
MVSKQAAILRMQSRVRPQVLALERKAALEQKLAAGGEVDEGFAHGSASEESGSERGDADDDSSSDASGDVDMDVEDRLDATIRAAAGRVEADGPKAAKKRLERVMPCEEARAHLRLLFRNEAVVCALLYGGHGQFAKSQRLRNVSSSSPYASLPPASADIFFMAAVPVPPTRFRPASKMADIVFENPQNDSLLRILQTSFRVRDLNTQMRAVGTKTGPDGVEPLSAVLLAAEHRRVYGMLLDAVHQLQVDVNSFMDSSKNPTIIRGGGAPPPGVKQVLEKKEGLFRKHMMVRPPHALRDVQRLTTAFFRRSCRASVSTTPPVPSSRPTSTSRPTRSACRLSLRASSPSPSLSRSTTSTRCARPSSTARPSTRARRWLSTRTARKSRSFVVLPPLSPREPRAERANSCLAGCFLAFRTACRLSSGRHSPTNC